MWPPTRAWHAGAARTGPPLRRIDDASASPAPRGGQLAREDACAHGPAAAEVLTGPHRREVVTAAALGFAPQRQHGTGGKRKWRDERADRAEIADQAVDDAARRPAGEHVGDRGHRGVP